MIGEQSNRFLFVVSALVLLALAVVISQRSLEQDICQKMHGTYNAVKNTCTFYLDERGDMVK